MKKRTFKEWKAEVDEAIQARASLHADDLPDYDYHKAYQEGVSILKAAKAAIANAKR